ncbi:MAG TPA: MaoC family dehydratase [Pirellulales bacterium]|nr:MaoC family dehydratase [Pirellulales bacterium]
MANLLIKGLEGLRSLVGQHLGTSSWVTITQERIDAFAAGTGDEQWIHCDPNRCRTQSPYGTTVAHGFLTLSLCNCLVQDIFEIEGVQMILNYGVNRVRFPAPVRSGARVRMHCELVALKESGASVQATFKQSFEVDGETKPACVAETVVRIFF